MAYLTIEYPNGKRTQIPVTQMTSHQAEAEIKAGRLSKYWYGDPPESEKVFFVSGKMVPDPQSAGWGCAAAKSSNRKHAEGKDRVFVPVGTHLKNPEPVTLKSTNYIDFDFNGIRLRLLAELVNYG